MTEQKKVVVFKTKGETQSVKGKRTLFIVDGLDQFDKRDREEVIKHLEALYSIIKSRGLNARVEITK